MKMFNINGNINRITELMFKECSTLIQIDIFSTVTYFCNH